MEKWICVFLFQLHPFTLRSPVYVELVVRVVSTLCVTSAIIKLVDLLINFYAIVAIVVVVVVVVVVVSVG